jgi:RNA polymerase sigma-70 factor, ECF subfamily
MNQQERHEMFSELLTMHQGQLHGYILALVRNRADADDLFQTTCLVLWRKFDTFRPGSSFFAWARRTAELEVRNFLKRNRSLLVPFSEELLDALAATDPHLHSDAVDAYLASLRRCIDKLRPEDQRLLDFCYTDDLSVQQIAEQTARSRQSVGKSLLRIRRELLRCVGTQLLQEEHL